MQLSLSTAIVVLAALVGTVVGETHTVHLSNFCGASAGHPVLQAANGSVLSTGSDYVSNGPLVNAIAYFQNNRAACGSAGERCTVVKTTLRNGKGPLNSSLSSLAVRSPYAFTTTAGFKYTNGCTSTSAYCNSAQCSAATNALSCTVDNVGLSISFCGPP